jgi:hypothetical protein
VKGCVATKKISSMGMGKLYIKNKLIELFEKWGLMCHYGNIMIGGKSQILKKNQTHKEGASISFNVFISCNFSSFMVSNLLELTNTHQCTIC